MGDSPIHHQETKESSQRADLVLKTCPAQPLASVSDVGFDIAGFAVCQGDAGFIQVLEKALCREPMMGDSGRSESAYFVQVSRIIFDQNPSRTWKGGRFVQAT